MPFRASRRSERSRRGPAPDEAAGFLAGAVARSELAFGQEVKARLLQERAQGFPVEAQGSPSLHSMTLTSSFEGTQVAVRVGRGHDGREPCQERLKRQDRIAVDTPREVIRRVTSRVIEPASFSRLSAVAACRLLGSRSRQLSTYLSQRRAAQVAAGRQSPRLPGVWFRPMLAFLAQRQRNIAAYTHVPSHKNSHFGGPYFLKIEEK
jgi:hypothetical protein